jgi:preprotein translocase subunit SecG
MVVINKHSIALFISSFLMGFVFLFFNYHNNYYLGLLNTHGEIGYNIYQYNSIKINPVRAKYIRSLQKERSRMVDYAEIDHQRFGPPTKYRSINDTIGYGVLLGLLWKLTGSLRYLDVQILQILMFAFLMFLLYSIAFMLFGSMRIALWCGIAQLCFLPIFYQNAQVMRDIWAYYAIAVLLWSVATMLYTRSNYWVLAVGAIVFSLMQHMRPTVSTSLGLISLCLVFSVLFDRTMLKKITAILAILWVVNGLVFWLPFVSYNKVAYNHWIVMPSGQWLVEGLGEYPNRWDFKLSDCWLGEYIEKKYDVHYGTAEFDDKAKEEFWTAYHDNPWYFYKNVISRVPQMILPGLSWNNYTNLSKSHTYHSFWEKVKIKLAAPFSSWAAFIDFLTRQIYLCIFLLLGYAGMLLALLRRRYLALMLILAAGIIPAYACILSHIEYRYVTPFYGVFSLFVGYFFVYAYDRYIGIHSKQKTNGT